ncbi:hypothetical protein [Marinobacter sp. F4216]|uniref:hypothetical protein n=1 Tax=Marinobacter sp. F4216 TaxID=2874281 RepID=UPI001CBAE378|nr:hypothetical protein [Marinobacter sp. F4216]MBZ2167370.1 hypothetical protein [Marinobacter sp. F4216]
MLTPENRLRLRAGPLMVAFLLSATMARPAIAESTFSNGGISHVGTTQVWDSDGQNMRIRRPSGSKEGDLLVLFLHRTDDVLPFHVDGWQRAGECYKENNGYDCLTVPDCTDISGSFCNRFENSYYGDDLAQVVLTREVSPDEPDSYTFHLGAWSDGQPGWAILTALRGADTRDPVRDWSHRGCDNDPRSAFPPVDGRKGDMLLLSQSFDDAVSQRRFGAPSGTSTFGYVSNSDEAGFLYGGLIMSDGPTGVMETRGDGASSCKDALISLTIRPR